MLSEVLTNVSTALSSDAGWMLAATLRSAVVLAGAVLLAAVFRCAGARVRAGVLAIGLLAALLVPALAGVVPGWAVPLPATTTTTAHDRPTAETALLGLDADAIVDVLLAAPEHVSDALLAAPAPAVAATTRSAPAVTTTATLAGAVWGLGACAVLAWLALGLLRIRAIVRSAAPLDDAGWNDAVREAAHRIGIRRSLRVLVSPDVPTPMTGGVLRPVVLLPPAALTWSDERRAIVLRHELVHVRRLDWLAQIIARVACAVYWFNPLAWVAARWLHLERERACDAGVIALGTPPSIYARHLLDVALARSNRIPAPMAALAMAHRSELEVRLMSIRKHRPARRGFTAMLPALIGVSVLALGSAAVEPFAPTGPPDDLAREIERMEKELAVAKKKLAAMKAAKPAEPKAHASHSDKPHEIHLELEALDGKDLGAEIQRAIDMAMKQIQAADGQARHRVHVVEHDDKSSVDPEELERIIVERIAPLEEKIRVKVAPIEQHLIAEIEPLQHEIEVRLKPILKKIEAADGDKEALRAMALELKAELTPLKEQLHAELMPLKEQLKLKIEPLREELHLELMDLAKARAHAVEIDKKAAHEYMAQTKRYLTDLDPEAARKLVAQAQAHAAELDHEAILKLVEKAKAHAHAAEIDRDEIHAIVRKAMAHADAEAVDHDSIRKIVEKATAHADRIRVHAEEAQRHAQHAHAKAAVEAKRRDGADRRSGEVAELRAMLEQLRHELAELKRQQHSGR